MATSTTAAEAAISMQKRWLLACLLSASIAINLVDRQVFNFLGPVLRENLHWTATQFSYTAAAFYVGMLAGQVPAGMFLDAVGTRVGLATLLVLWSALGAIHALAAALTAFIVVRFFMGVAQCGNYGAGIKAIAGLFPAEKRSSAGGIFNAGAQLGSVIVPPLVGYLLHAAGLRMAFVLPAVVGLVWLIPWLAIYPGKQQSQAASGQKAGATINLQFDKIILRSGDHRLRLTAQVFNLLQNEAYETVTTTNYFSSGFLTPATWLPSRYVKIGARFDF